MYFKDGKKEWEKVLAFCDNQECKVTKKAKEISIISEEYDDLVKKLGDINWC